MSRPSLRLLAIDPAPDSAAMFAELARSMGAVADAVTDARAALQLAAHTRYDVVVFEPVLPSLHGYTMVVQLRRAWGQAAGTSRFIAISGSPPHPSHPDFTLADIERHLIKPVSLETFVQEVLTWPKTA